MADITEEQKEKISILEEKAVATLGIRLNQDTITYFSDKSMQEIKDMDNVEFITYLCGTGKLEYFTVDSDLTCRKSLSQVPYRYRDFFAERFLRDLNDKDIVLEGRNNEKENAFLNQLAKIGVYVTSIDGNIPFIYDMAGFESVITSDKNIKHIELCMGEKIEVSGSLSNDKQRKKLLKVVREKLNGEKKQSVSSSIGRAETDNSNLDMDSEDFLELDENYFDLPPIDDLEDTLTEINTTQTREEEKHIPIEPKEKGASSIVKREKTPEEIQGDLKDRFGIEVPLEKCKTYLQAYNTIGSLSTVNSLRVMWKEDIWKEIGEAKDFEVALAKGEKISNKTIKAFYFRYFLPGLDGKKPEQGVTYDLTNGKNHNPIFEVAADSASKPISELVSEPEKEPKQEPGKEPEKEAEKQLTGEPGKDGTLKGTYTPTYMRPDWHMRSIEEMEIEAYLRKPGDTEREEKEEERWVKRMKNFYDRSRMIAQKDKQTILKAIKEIKENHKSTGPIDRD